MQEDPQSAKTTDDLNVNFGLLKSLLVKALHKMLVKSTPALYIKMMKLRPVLQSVEPDGLFLHLYSDDRSNGTRIESLCRIGPTDGFLVPETLSSWDNRWDNFLIKIQEKNAQFVTITEKPIKHISTF